MNKLLAPLLSLSLVAACSQDPKASAARTVVDAAENRADMVAAAADNRADVLTNEADVMRNGAKATVGYDAEIAKTRAAALDQEARLVREQGRMKADAERSEGEAQAKRIRAQ